MKKFTVLFSAIVMVAVVAICIYINDRDSINSVKFIVDADNGVTQSVNLFCYDGKYYAFLPSYADFDNIKIQYNVDSLYLDGMYFNSDSSFSGFVVDKEYSLELKSFFGIPVYKTSLILMRGGDIPTLSIDLLDGNIDEINKNKELSKSGYATIINQDKTLDYRGSFKQLHGRGNSSWGQQKKPYALEFSEKVNLLGVGEYSDYVLAANAMDESNLRNKIVYDAAKKLRLPNSVNSEFVDLYINDDYMGLYLLTNKISMNNDESSDLLYQTQKINQYSLSSYDTFEKENDGIQKKGYSIPKDPKDISGSYLLEFELDARVQNENCLFTTKSGQSLTVKYPKYVSEKQMDYISEFIQKIEDSFGQEKALDYIDEESWTKYYLLQEVFANTSKTSFFFQKYIDDKDLKLYSGPIWDFDLSMGTYYENNNASPYKLYCNWGWFEKYHQNPKCMNNTVSRYKNEIRPLIQSIIANTIDQYEKKIEKSYCMNEKRWDGIQSNWWVNHYDTQKEHSIYLKNFLEERLNYLDYLWLGEKLPEINSKPSVNIYNEDLNDDIIVSVFDRIMMKINNERYYIYFGLLFFVVFISCFVIRDLGKCIIVKRNKNGNKR